jgi:hypothetical protein
LFCTKRFDGRGADGDAQRIVGKLVRIDEGGLVALVGLIGVLLGIAVELALQVDRQDALVAQRIDRHQIDRARQTHAQHIGAGGLDDVDAVEHVAGKLAVIEAAVVIDGRDFAMVEQRPGEIARETADRDHLAATLLGLHGNARQAADGVGDGDIGQLADVLGRQGFDHRHRSRLARSAVASERA